MEPIVMPAMKPNRSWAFDSSLVVRGLVLLAALALAYTCWQVAAYRAVPLLQGQPVSLDFHVYYDAAVRVLLGEPLYALDAVHPVRKIFLYPPASLFLFLPFTVFPAASAYVVFLCTSLLAFAVSAAIWSRLLFGRARWRLVLPALALGAVYHTHEAGQVNGFVLLAVTLYVWGSKKRRPVLAGLFLGLGFWLKLYPVVLALPALFHRQHRPGLAYALGWILAVPLLLWPVVPLHLYQDYFRVFLPQLSGLTVSHYTNMSFLAEAVRLQLGLPFAEYHVAGVDPWLKNCAAAALACYVAVLSVMGVRSSRFGFAAVAGLALAALPLFSPLGWGHHFAVAVPLVVFAVGSVWLQPGRTPKAWLGAGLVAACWLALCIPPFTLSPPWMPEVLRHVFYLRYGLGIAMLTAYVLACAPHARWNGEGRPL